MKRLIAAMILLGMLGCQEVPEIRVGDCFRDPYGEFVMRVEFQKGDLYGVDVVDMRLKNSVTRVILNASRWKAKDFTGFTKEPCPQKETR